jgi:hypothetical protein
MKMFNLLFLSFILYLCHSLSHAGQIRNTICRSSVPNNDKLIYYDGPRCGWCGKSGGVWFQIGYRGPVDIQSSGCETIGSCATTLSKHQGY